WPFSIPAACQGRNESICWPSRANTAAPRRGHQGRLLYRSRRPSLLVVLPARKSHASEQASILAVARSRVKQPGPGPPADNASPSRPVRRGGGKTAWAQRVAANTAQGAI